MSLRITTLSESTAGRDNLLAEWGLSIMMENEKTSVLLDTGSSISATHNADALGIDLSKIDKIVLSHGHYDHTGGLRQVLQKMRKEIEIIAHPDIWQAKYARRNDEQERYIGIPFQRNELESLGAVFNLTAKPVRIDDSIMTTGEIPMVTTFEEVDTALFVKKGPAWQPDKLLDDQALIVNMELGLVVILGCAHRGIINTLYHVRQLIGREEIYAVIGGSHLINASEERLGHTIGALREKGVSCSASTVNRIIHRLKERGVLKESLPNHISARKRPRQRPYAIRRPKGYGISQIGDMVQLDTLDVRPLPGVVLKHFTAHDVISRWNTVSVYSRATANTATAFLDILEKRMPFPVKAIQVDGGAEFEAIFEEACQQRGIKLFVLPPRSPKLNGAVERAHRTHTEEFYEVTESSFDLSELRQELLEWERIYNTVRPHQALGYMTPFKFLEQRKEYSRKEKVSPII